MNLWGLVLGSFIVSSSSSAPGTGLDPYVTVGVGAGGIFVAAGLVYHLGFLELLTAAEFDEEIERRMQLTLLAVIVPLLLTFVAVVVFNSLVAIGLM